MTRHRVQPRAVLSGGRWRKQEMARAFVLMLGALLWVALPASGQTSSSRFEVTHYTIDATLYPSTHIVAAKVAIDLTPKTDLTEADFSLDSALKVTKVIDAQGQPVSFQQQGLSLKLSFLNPLPQGKSTMVAVEYSGLLASADGSPVEDLKLAYVGAEGSYLLYPSCWFPVNQYAVNRFSSTLRITVPSGETVVASGEAGQPENTADGVTYSFQYSRSSFPGTVIAGKYAIQPVTVAGANITVYLKPGHEQFAASYGDEAQKCLEFYSTEFGPLPDGHLSIVEIDDGTVGGYSAPGMVAIASRGFTNPVNVNLLAHEISHQWWRCLVSPASPDDAFLDEGLATYSAAMYEQYAEGESAFETAMQRISVGALTHESAAPIAQASQLHEFTPEYESVVFDKGAMVFHMLRWVIGNNDFLKTLRTMAQQYAGKSISTRQFQKLAEAASHHQLTYFFAQWVDSTGVPQFKRTWAIYLTQTGYQVVGKVQQDLDIFRMPVDIRVYVRGRPAVNDRLEMVGTTADFTINTKGRPVRVEVDPASYILKYTDQTKIQVEMARADQLYQEQAYFEAIKAYRQVLDLNPNDSLAHYRIGETLFKLHNYNAALEEFRQCLNGDLQPKWVEVWSYLEIGKIFDATGQRDRALNEYQRALQTNDNTQGALDQASVYMKKPYAEKSNTIS
ncbi:MAG: M1 family aminopeptidase [Terriglobia bacterium]